MKKSFIAMSAVFMFLLLIAGCGIKDKVEEKATEKAAEKIMEKAMNSKVDVDYKDDKITLKTDGGDVEVATETKWPDDLPKNVKKLKGKTTTVTRSTLPDGKSWSVLMEDVKEDDVNNYADDLEKDGWEVISSKSPSGLFVIASKEDENIAIGTDSVKKTASFAYSYEE